MLAYIATGVIVLIIWAALKAGGWAAANPSIIAAGIFAIGFIWVLFYHRRKMAEIEALDYDARGRFSRVNRGTPWPRWCRWCGASIANPRAAHIHNEPDSECSAHRIGAERAAAAAATAEWLAGGDDPPEPVTWSATVQPGPAGGLDTFTDDPAAIGAGDEEP